MGATTGGSEGYCPLERPVNFKHTLAHTKL